MVGSEGVAGIGGIGVEIGGVVGAGVIGGGVGVGGADGVALQPEKTNTIAAVVRMAKDFRYAIEYFIGPPRYVRQLGRRETPITILYCFLKSHKILAEKITVL